ncbi:hypothetical protein [Luteibacter sp.]|uniref:hypothetical protein n=1 Tax=Luteibacter sp. TaxID=1886636 RepID=UPI003F7ECEB3
MAPRSLPIVLPPRRPLARALTFCLVAAAFAAGTASAQSTLPAPTLPAVNKVQTGAAAPDQSSGTGVTPDAVDIELTNGQVAPSVQLGAVGGAGGTGVDGTDTSGNGGTGGAASTVTLTLDAGSGVNSTGTAPAVWLYSTGGAGGAPGGLSEEDATPGQPGAGGNGQAVTFNQYGSVLSSNGWNGSVPGATAVWLTSTGGAGGQPTNIRQGAFDQTGPAGSAGGSGGNVTYYLYAGDVLSQGSAIVAASQGGQGGDGTGANSYTAEGKGGRGGLGGEGGFVNLIIGEYNSTVVSHISAMGAASAASGAVIPVDADGNVAQAALMAAGIQALSAGGVGGNGGTGDGTAGKAGPGGAAGDGGLVQVAVSSTDIATKGYAAAGALAQSIGGAGGNGSTAGGMFSQHGGSGGAGGNGGEVDVGLWERVGTVPNSVLSTFGDDSIGVAAQSIGGGGGAGGSVQGGSVFAGVSIGGNGETGGSGGVVTLYNGYPVRVDGSPAEPGQVIITGGTHASALVAQSIGGGGGTGGSAQNSDAGVFTYAVGGAGGTGGDAGTPGTTQVTAYNSGIALTGGNHAKGLVAQAVGGGGGDGGSATAMSASSLVNVNVSVGGTGGKGGTSGDVHATNAGQILTSGSDAWGMLAQSVAGGGGNGGMTKSDALQFLAPDVPNIEINAAIGGNGGDGAASGNVFAYNQQLIMTSGAAAHGILAQSVSGGGGNGGDSSADTLLIGKATSIDVTVALGGSGAGGGTAGNVTADNSAGALIWTAGDSANGILASSVGGGGGTGGTGKDDTYTLGKTGNGSGSYTMSLGGKGGNGSDGGTVTASNEGRILTIGDSGNGIFAQSIGNGGGLGTGGTAKGSSGKLSQTVTVSSSVGSPGNGGAVNATNSGIIVTAGGDAAGIYAQSVGGGGGKGGSGSTAGLPGSAGQLSDYLGQSSVLAGLLGTYGGALAWQAGAWNTDDTTLELWARDYLAYAAAHPIATPSDATGATTSVALFLGGGSSGGSDGGPVTKGDGGQVTATNTGIIQVFGAASPGILAQSVGAGGGQAGATAVDKLKDTSGNTQGVVSKIGGNADNTGNGGAVTVTNNGVIGTSGDAGFGIFAQSVGAGGGESIVTASNYGVGSKPIQITLGGQISSTGDGGNITVNNTSTGAAATINTWGNDAVGIVAQSIGGAGGNAVVMQTTGSAVNTNGASSGVTNPLADPTGSLNTVVVGSNASGNTNTPLSLCAMTGGYYSDACGSGGSVTVSTSANTTVATTGRDSHGVLAQSIGGGGGWVTGISLAAGVGPFNKPVMAGNGGDLALTLAGSISTTGDGAYGILAQTIGGGGILGGDLATTTTTGLFDHSFYADAGNTRFGTGGNITIQNSGSIVTSGANAHAIFAQSAGGGGGLWAMSGGQAYMGYVGGAGSAGTINITNSGLVQASGSGSSAIYVDSQGQSQKAQVVIMNELGGVIEGNATAPAIMLRGGNTNGDGLVYNSGSIWVSNPNGSIAGTYAIASLDSYSGVQNSASGQIRGNLDLGSGGAMENAGYWGTSNFSSIGDIDNTGVIDVNGAAAYAPVASVIDGTLHNNGTIKVAVDFFNREATSLVPTAAYLSGSTILVKPDTLSNAAMPVVGNVMDLKTNSQLTVIDTPNYLFNYTWLLDPMLSLEVAPTPRLVQQAQVAGLSSNEQALAQSLQTNFQNNTLSASSATALAALNAASVDPTSYGNALSQMQSEGAQAAAVAHVVAGNAFVERMNSCPRFDDGAQFQHEHDCFWGRVIAGSGDRDSGGSSVGYHQNGQTYQLGGQREVATDWFVGASASADNSSLATRSVHSSVNGNGWTAGLIGKHQMGSWLVSMGVDGGRMSYDSRRNVQLGALGGTARGSFDVSHWGIHSRVSDQIAFDHAYLKPYIDLHATHIDSGSYTERGAGSLDLRVAGSSSNILSVSPMLEAGSKFAFDNDTSLQLYAGLGGSFYSKGNLGASMQFAQDAAGAGWFEVKSDLPQSRLKTTAGLDWRFEDRWDVRLEYTGEFASHFDSKTGALKVSYRF